MQTEITNIKKQRFKRIGKDLLGALSLVIFLGACQSAMDKTADTGAAISDNKAQVATSAKAGNNNQAMPPEALQISEVETWVESKRHQDSAPTHESIEVSLTNEYPVSEKMVMSSGGTGSLMGGAHEQELRNFIGRLSSWKSVSHISVTGHTDSLGNLIENETLSVKRAAAVAGKLAEMGLDKTEFQVLGKGELEPVGDNSTRDGRAQNRRVEIVAEGVEIKTGPQIAVAIDE